MHPRRFLVEPLDDIAENEASPENKTGPACTIDSTTGRPEHAIGIESLHGSGDHKEYSAFCCDARPCLYKSVHAKRKYCAHPGADTSPLAQDP